MSSALFRINVCAALLAAFALSAVAQDWPSRPLKIVVPFAAGGNTDVVARTVAIRLQDILGQGVIVENKAGAGGVIATDYVAKSAPDGYTLLMSSLVYFLLFKPTEKKLRPLKAWPMMMAPCLFCKKRLRSVTLFSVDFVRLACSPL